MKRKTLFLAAAAAVAVAPLVWWAASADSNVSLTHVHGLTYSADGSKLMVPSHHGLAVLSTGEWTKAPGPQHDYMGFSGTASAVQLRSSGTGLRPAESLWADQEHGRRENLGTAWARRGVRLPYHGRELWNQRGIRGESSAKFAHAHGRDLLHSQ